MDKLTRSENLGQSDHRSMVRESVQKLDQLKMFPERETQDSESMIINLCKEERWAINPDTNSIISGFFNKELVSTTQSLGRIDAVVTMLDDNITLKHSWSRLVTYVDLVKNINESLQIRLRYELYGNEIFVKWIVVDNSQVEDKVYVLIAESDNDVSFWENKFLEVMAIKKSISIKVFKSFLLDSEGQLLEDYSYTELDDNRLETDLDSKRHKLNITSDFVGVYVQDRFSLPLVDLDEKGLLDFPQVMDLIKNELRNVPDKLAVLKRFNLRNDEIRVELESHVEPDNQNPDNPLMVVTNIIKGALSDAESQNLLRKKN